MVDAYTKRCFLDQAALLYEERQRFKRQRDDLLMALFLPLAAREALSRRILEERALKPDQEGEYRKIPYCDDP